MRICIFGAGAVGSHFAVRLALAGHDVSCVMRGAHLEAVKARGLTLRVGDADFPAKVKASDDPAALGPQDLVISTLKATGGRQPGRGPAAAAGRRHRGGVRAERHSLVVRHRACSRSSAAARPRLSRSRRRLARRRRAEQIIGGVIFSSNEVVEPGVVANLSPDRNMLQIGERDDRSSPTDRTAARRARCGRDQIAADAADPGDDLVEAPDQHVDVGAVPVDRADRARRARRSCAARRDPAAAR